MPEQRAAEQHRDDHQERVDVHRPLLDLGLDQVVLHLLVDDRPDDPDDRGGREVVEQRDDARRAPRRSWRRPAGSGPGRRSITASGAANGTPRIFSTMKERIPASGRLEEGPCHVVADRARGALQHALDPRRRAPRAGTQPASIHRRPPAEHERGEDQDRDHGEDRVDDPDAHVARGSTAASPSLSGQLPRLLLELRGDVVVLVELAQPLVVLYELRHVARRSRGRSRPGC